MKDLTVRAQTNLSPARTMGLTVAGIAVRLFRSLITVVILALAVTFLCHGLAHSLIVHESRYHAYEQLREYREPSQWNTRLTTPDARPTIWRNLANRRQPFITEYARWAGADQATMEQVSTAAAKLLSIRAYFDSIPEAKKIVLLEGRSLMDMLGGFTDERIRAEFARKLDNVAMSPPEGGVEALGDFAVDDLPKLLAFTEAARNGHRQAIRQISQATGGDLPLVWFAEHGEQIQKVVEQAGYVMKPQAVSGLVEAGRDFLALEQLKEGLEQPKVTTAMVRRLNINPRELHVDVVADWLDGNEEATWLSQLLSENLDKAPSAERLLLAAEHYRERNRLQDAVGGGGEVTARTGLFDLPTNTQWLIMLSFLVCAVGVTNAMFMSVTERFTEIATMKCLGALDGFLMQMFLYESAIQGIVGSLAGILLGIGIAFLRGLLNFGGIALESMPWVDLAAGAGLSFLVGLMLAVFAGVGPALAVARLAPMEAMRIE